MDRSAFAVTPTVYRKAGQLSRVYLQFIINALQYCLQFQYKKRIFKFVLAEIENIMQILEKC